MSKIRTIEYVLNWKNKPGVPVATRIELVIPKYFSIVARQLIREVYIERKELQALDLIFERKRQKKVTEFGNLKFFYGDEIPGPNSIIWIWGRTSLYRL